MKPADLVSALRRIASGIENSKNPSRHLVANDLKQVMRKVALDPERRKVNVKEVHILEGTHWAGHHQSEPLALDITVRLSDKTPEEHRTEVEKIYGDGENIERRLNSPKVKEITKEFYEKQLPERESKILAEEWVKEAYNHRNLFYKKREDNMLLVEGLDLDQNAMNELARQIKMKWDYGVKPEKYDPRRDPESADYEPTR